MAEENSTGKLAYFVIGFGIGAVVALLFAPKSGKELREDIVETTRRGVDKATETYQVTRDKAKELASSGRQKASDVLEGAKGRVQEERERLASAVEAGKQAYQEKKQKASLEG